MFIPTTETAIDFHLNLDLSVGGTWCRESSFRRFAPMPYARLKLQVYLASFFFSQSVYSHHGLPVQLLAFAPSCFPLSWLGHRLV